jgi:hypothetical protein
MLAVCCKTARWYFHHCRWLVAYHCMMFMLILFCFVLNEAVMMHEPLACHQMRVLCAVLESIRATSSICGAFSSSWPENSSLSPVARLFCPLPVHHEFQGHQGDRLSHLSSHLSCFSCFVLGPNIPCPMFMVAPIERMVIG